MNVDVPSKGKDAIVGLGKVHAAGRVLLLVVLKVAIPLQVFGGGPDKGQFAGGAKGHADGNVLALGPFGIESGRVMVEGL